MSPCSFHNGKTELYAGDCMDVLRKLPDNSIDAVVTDPPYHLTTNKKGGTGVASINLKSPHGRSRIGTGNGAGGFMGQQWDGGDIAFTPELWAEVLRVLKPGGHMVCFGGTRTYHRLACAVEDAGFEIRDQLAWTYGSGFPKSHNIGNGWGTALKPAWEPICLARKPISEGTVAANVLRWGTGAINVDGCRVATKENLNGGAYSGSLRQRDEYTSTDSVDGAVPLSRLNRGAGEYKQPIGRFPANLIHDGSPEVLTGFPETTTGNLERAGSAARFFYTAKADADDRLGSKHPTVKPVDLMQWLVRLICPKGGTVLDPFAGTGTTGAAAFREGCRAVLIEREAEYLADIERRMEMLLSGPDERARKLAKADPYSSLPLFGT